MKNYLTAQGFLYTENNELTNRQFAVISNTINLDEDNTTMDNPSYIEDQSYIVFLDNKSYSATVMIDKLNAILTATRADNKLVTGQIANIEKVDGGYDITMDFTINDL